MEPSGLTKAREKRDKVSARLFNIYKKLYKYKMCVLHAYIYKFIYNRFVDSK